MINGITSNSLILGVLILILFGTTTAVSADSVTRLKGITEIAWAQFDGENREIYYRRFDGQSWEEKVQITRSLKENILPSISSGSDGSKWIVWSTIEGPDVFLSFSRYKQLKWMEPKRISTGLSSNTAPSIAVDKKNIPWIVWAGFDGHDDEIYFTRWNGEDWDPPSMVNQDDLTPDILPEIGMSSSGHPYVVWSGYDGNKYREYFSQWSIAGWTNETKNGHEQAAYTSGTNTLRPDISILPDDIEEPEKVSVHIRGASGIQSLRPHDFMKGLH